MVKCLNIGKNIGKPIYRSISNNINRRTMLIFIIPNSQLMRQVDGNTALYSFTDESAAVRPAECAASLPLTAQKRRRERRHCAGRVGPCARWAVLETSSN